MTAIELRHLTLLLNYLRIIMYFYLRENKHRLGIFRPVPGHRDSGVCFVIIWNAGRNFDTSKLSKMPPLFIDSWFFFKHRIYFYSRSVAYRKIKENRETKNINISALECFLEHVVNMLLNCLFVSGILRHRL